jgi:hypothetical protein
MQCLKRRSSEKIGLCGCSDRRSFIDPLCSAKSRAAVTKMETGILHWYACNIRPGVEFLAFCHVLRAPSQVVRFVERFGYASPRE